MEKFMLRIAAMTELSFWIGMAISLNRWEEKDKVLENLIIQ